MARLSAAPRGRWHIAAVVAVLLGVSVAGVVKATASDGAAPTQAYSVTDMGTLGGSFAFAFAVNNRSQATGVSTLPGDVVVHGFLWQSGAMTDLGTLGGSFCPANSINEHTQLLSIATIPGG